MRSFRVRLLSKTASRSCENEAFVQELLQKVQVEVAKHSFRARHPSKTAS